MRAIKSILGILAIYSTASAQNSQEFNHHLDTLEMNIICMFRQYREDICREDSALVIDSPVDIYFVSKNNIINIDSNVGEQLVNFRYLRDTIFIFSESIEFANLNNQVFADSLSMGSKRIIRSLKGSTFYYLKKEKRYFYRVTSFKAMCAVYKIKKSSLIKLYKLDYSDPNSIVTIIIIYDAKDIEEIKINEINKSYKMAKCSR